MVEAFRAQSRKLQQQEEEEEGTTPLFSFSDPEQARRFERLDDVIMGGRSSSVMEAVEDEEDGGGVGRCAEFRGNLVVEVGVRVRVRACVCGICCAGIYTLSTPTTIRLLCPRTIPDRHTNPDTPPHTHPHIHTNTNEQDGGFCGHRASGLGLDLTGFDGLRLRVKGDGNRYKLNLKTADARQAPESVYQVMMMVVVVVV